MSFPILTYMIFTPLLGLVVVLLLRKEQVQVIRWASAFFTFIPLLLSFFLVAGYDSSTANMQFVEKHDWIPSLGVNYYLGADGLSVSVSWPALRVITSP